MTFTAKAKFDKPAVILFVDQTKLKQKEIHAVTGSLRNNILALAQAGGLTGGEGELFPIFLDNRTIVAAGLGKPSQNSVTALTSLRIAARKTILSPFLNKSKEIEIIPPDDRDTTIQATIEGILIGGYSWKKYLTKDKEDKSVKFEDKKFYVAAPKKKLFEDTITICEGVNLTRDLINDNADVVTSEFLEGTIKKIVKGNKHVRLEILNEKELKAKGLNLHLAVNQGSPKEPKLIIIRYKGGNPKDPYTAFVGKGITFDTGGLNLKPTGSIETMRSDMSGAAAVIGTLKNTIALNLRKNILFVTAIAENAVGSRSFKPGDVIKGYSGKTVEIGNTDAEGRLVLADAIAYVIKNYKPNRLIDIATLTGACVVALGHDYSGLISTDEELAAALLKSAQETDDRLWRLPSYPEIKNYVKSQYADLKNIGTQKGVAGACTAAEFLRQFADGTKWAHLDIAGTAFSEGQGRMYFGYGATGAGVRLLTEYLRKN